MNSSIKNIFLKSITFVIVLLILNHCRVRKGMDDLSHIDLSVWEKTPFSDFRIKQEAFERVRNAYLEKEDYVKRLLVRFPKITGR